MGIYRLLVFPTNIRTGENYAKPPVVTIWRCAPNFFTSLVQCFTYRDTWLCAWGTRCRPKNLAFREESILSDLNEQILATRVQRPPSSLARDMLFCAKLFKCYAPRQPHSASEDAQQGTFIVPPWYIVKRLPSLSNAGSGFYPGFKSFSEKTQVRNVLSLDCLDHVLPLSQVPAWFLRNAVKLIFHETNLA